MGVDIAEDIVIQFFASFLIWLLFAGLVVLWFIDGKIKKEQVIHALFASLVAWIAAIVIKHFFPTLRPFMLNGHDVDVFVVPTNGSFPSEHMTWAFAISVTVFLHDRKVGWYFLGAALAIGLARILANVHYPIDILGGAFIGTLAAVIVEKTHLFKLFKAKK